MTRFYQAQGGLFTREDFATYEPIWAEPVHVTYRGYEIYSSPSTSRGGFEVTMQLNLIEGFDLAALGHNSAAMLHLVAESIKVAKSDVYHFVADPSATEVPTEKAVVEGVRRAPTYADPAGAGDGLSGSRHASGRGDHRRWEGGVDRRGGLRAQLSRQHHQLLGRRSLRQRRRVHTDARQWVGHRRRRGDYRTDLQQRRAPRLHLAISRRRQLRARGADPGSQQLTHAGDEGRDVLHVARHAGWRDDRANAVFRCC